MRAILAVQYTKDKEGKLKEKPRFQELIKFAGKDESAEGHKDVILSCYFSKNKDMINEEHQHGTEVRNCIDIYFRNGSIEIYTKGNFLVKEEQGLNNDIPIGCIILEEMPDEE